VEPYLKFLAFELQCTTIYSCALYLKC